MKFIPKNITYNTETGKLEFSVLDHIYSLRAIAARSSRSPCFVLPDFFDPLNKSSLVTLEDAVRLIRYGDGDVIANSRGDTVRYFSEEKYKVIRYMNRTFGNRARQMTLEVHRSRDIKEYYIYFYYEGRKLYVHFYANEIIYCAKLDPSTSLPFRTKEEAERWIQEQNRMPNPVTRSIIDVACADKDMIRTICFGTVPDFKIGEHYLLTEGRYYSV